MLGKKSSGEFDVVKGFAIILVIFAHTFFYKIETFQDHQTTALIYSFGKLFVVAMPIFFFVTGYFSIKSVKMNVRRFIFLRIRLILIPYLLWSTFYIIVENTIMRGYFGVTPFNSLEVIKKYVFGNAVDEFYFLFVILILYMITPLFSKMNSEQLKMLLIPFFIAMIASSSAYYISIYFEKILISPMMYLRNPLIWMFFYVWGMYTYENAKKNGVRWRNKISNFWKIMAAMSYVGAVVEFYAMPLKTLPGVILLGPVGLIYCTFAIPIAMRLSYLFSLAFPKLSVTLRIYGRHTLGIYMINGFVEGLLFLVAVLFYPTLAVKSSLLINLSGFLIVSYVSLKIVKSVWNWNKKVYTTIF